MLGAMETPNFSLAIFDLGNVLFEVKWEGCSKKLAEMTGSDATELQSRFTFDQTLAEFEKGQIEPKEYHQHFCEQLEVKVSFEQFRECWQDIYGDVIQEVADAITQLAGKLQLVAFTNSNVLHNEVWPKLYEEAVSSFDRVFVSSDMGMRKPEQEGFEHIFEEMRAQPEEVLFFDDLDKNVEAALMLGMTAFVVDHPRVVPIALDELGLIQLGSSSQSHSPS